MLEWLWRRMSTGSPPDSPTPPPSIQPTPQPTAAYWIQVSGPELAQGDYLPSCLVPILRPDFGIGKVEESVPVASADLIVVTQSCDLENRKAPFVALCPIYSLARFEKVNPRFSKKGEWEQVRRGRQEGLHMLASPTDPQDNRSAFVVDFRQIFSLPFEYLRQHAANLRTRWRQQSPFLEHFSQAFARFFMRVGLPSAIPPFK